MGNEFSDYTRRLERLVEVCRNLSANLELEPLLQSIVEVSAELTHSAGAYILIYDDESACLRYVAGPLYRMEELEAVGVALDGSAAGWVYRHSAPSVVHCGEDARLLAGLSQELNCPVTSLLVVPLNFRGATIGVLEVFNKAGQVDYIEEDVVVLETLAAQAVIAIRNQKWLDQSQLAYDRVVEQDQMKSDFIALFSHELRTPLGVILGHASLLSESCASEEDRQTLNIIVRNAMRIREIITDFGNLNRFEAEFGRLKLSPVALNEVVQRAADDFADLARERQIEILVQVPKTRLSVQGDAEKIAIALRSLVKNALIFTDPGGKVMLRLDQVPGYVRVSVLDNGIGVPKDEQEKIFQRFYQVEKHMRRVHGGLGLGLSIARQMIEMHGGRIWVESMEGQGSRFMFVLPVDTAQAAAAERVFIT